MKLAASIAILILAPAAWCHHSFAAEFDGSKRVTLQGTVTKVEWTNPHARFYVDVKDESGAVATWNFELGSPLQLRRHGWTRDSLKEGDQVTVEGYPAKDGAKLASAKKITLADGRTVFGESPSDRPTPDSKPQ